MKSNLLLFLTAIFWGTSYVLTKICLGYTTASQLIFYRFFLSFIVTLIFFRKRILPIKKQELICSALLSIILLFVFVTMTLGLKYTSASNGGFIISLSVVFIPLFSYFISKEKISYKNFTFIVFSTIGIYLISIQENFAIQYGDFLCLLCAILFALHVSLIGSFSKKYNPITLGVLQFEFTSIYSLFLFKITPYQPINFNKEFIVSLILLSIFSTALGYIFQLVAQKNVTATTTAVILSLEPVFSAIFAYFILFETMNLNQIIGAVILFASAIGIQINFKNTKEEKLLWKTK